MILAGLDLGQTIDHSAFVFARYQPDLLVSRGSAACTAGRLRLLGRAHYLLSSRLRRRRHKEIPMQNFKVHGGLQKPIGPRIIAGSAI